VEGSERDSTQDWVLPAGSGPPLMSELERRVEEALAIARASEAAAMSVGEAALDAAEQARRAADMAERAARTAEAATGIIPTGTARVAGPRPVDPLDERLERFGRQADRVLARLREIESAAEPTAT
jgi:hypothetical protein